MKEKRSAHLRVQELCDCFATTDPLEEMAALNSDADPEEAALKWVALAVLHGIDKNAKKISIVQNDRHGFTVTAKYRETELPAPRSEIGEKILRSIREIAHIDGKKGKRELALGIRDSSIMLEIKVSSEKNREKVTLEFSEPGDEESE